jgi:hypothetical protein
VSFTLGGLRAALLEGCPKRAGRVVEARTCGPYRDAERLGHRHEGQAHVVVQDEHRALVEREPAECALQLVAIVDGSKGIGRVRSLEREDPNRGRPSPVPRRIRIARVDEDPECPGVEVVNVPQVRELSPDGDEGGLQDVLGERWVAQDASSDAEQGVADLMHQVREGLLVAGTSPLDEISVHLTLGCAAGVTAVYQ